MFKIVKEIPLKLLMFQQMCRHDSHLSLAGYIFFTCVCNGETAERGAGKYSNSRRA